MAHRGHFGLGQRTSSAGGSRLGFTARGPGPGPGGVPGFFPGRFGVFVPPPVREECHNPTGQPGVCCNVKYADGSLQCEGPNGIFYIPPPPKPPAGLYCDPPCPSGSVCDAVTNKCVYVQKLTAG